MSEVEELENRRAALKAELANVERELLAAKQRVAQQAQRGQRTLNVLPPDHPSFWNRHCRGRL